MGNLISQEYLKCDRLIDAENVIYIGIVSEKNKNPLSTQAIRIGQDGKLKRLEKFTETNNSIIYEFENDTILSLSKREKDIIINLKEPETDINLIKNMDQIVREIFKPIKFGNLSIEFDKIPKFIYPSIEDIKTDIGKDIIKKYNDTNL